MSGGGLRGAWVLAGLGLSACAQVVPVAEGVAQLPRKAVEGTVEAFEFVFSRPELAVEVVEVARLQHCNSSGRESTLEVLPNPISLAAWEEARGLKLTPASGDLPVGLYAVVEMGERNTGGYALVISRQGAVKDDTLYLKASYLSPSVSGMATQMLTSPCTLVALPTRSDFHKAVLIDQTGKLRARWTPLAP